MDTSTLALAETLTTSTLYLFNSGAPFLIYILGALTGLAGIGIIIIATKNGLKKLFKLV